MLRLMVLEKNGRVRYGHCRRINSESPLLDTTWQNFEIFRRVNE
jgi:hypothetical protein